MAKEKKMTLEQNKKDLTFYYELIGVSTILISLLALARLGMVGYYIMMVFRIIFGDWYFAFLLALLLFGIYCLFKHQPLNLKNMRSVGVIFFMIGILTISHFPMHNYISQFGTSYLKMTFSLYLDYFKNYQEGMIVGGGIIGMLFFYISYTLFSSVGTIVIVLFISFVGLSFTFNKTIGESLAIFKKIVIKFVNFFTRFGKTIKYGIKVKDDSESNKKPVEKVKTKKRKITIDDLTIPVRHNYIMTEEKHAAGLRKMLASVLNNMNIFYQNITYIVSEHITTYKIDTLVNINLDKLYMKLKSILTERFLITKDLDSPKIKIEIDNIECNPPYIKTMFELQKNYINNLKLPLGIDTNNELVEINFVEKPNLLIVENNQELVEKMINGYLLMLMIKLTKINYEYLIFDMNNTYKNYESGEYYNKDISLKLNELRKNVEKRLELINVNNCNNIEEYNQKCADKLPLRFLFIINLENLMQNKKDAEIILYLLQMGRQCGYYLIAQYGVHDLLPSIVDSLFVVKLIGKNSGLIGQEYVGIDPSNYLYEDEAFYLCQDDLFRFSLVKSSVEEGRILKNIK